MRKQEGRTGQIPDLLAGRQKTEAEEPVLAFPTGMICRAARCAVNLLPERTAGLGGAAFSDCPIRLRQQDLQASRCRFNAESS